MKCGIRECSRKAIEGYEKFTPAPSMEFPNHTLSQGVVGWCGGHASDLRPAFIGRHDVWLTTKQLETV
jgi:hypothetical protein